MSSQTIGDQRSPAGGEPQPTQADTSAHEGTQVSTGTRIPAQARAPQAETTAAEPTTAQTPAAARVTATGARTAMLARASVLPVAEPDEQERRPALKIVAGVCAWAAVLGLADLILVIRGLVTILGGSAPGWYEPLLIGLGLGGIALAVTAFMTVQFRIVPWIFMALSSAAVIASLIVTGMAS